MKNVLQSLVAGLFGFLLVFIGMRVTSVPEITFATHPTDGVEFIWSAKNADGTEMSTEDAQKHVDSGGRYVRQTHTLTPTVENDRFSMDLKPGFMPSF